jgi:H+/Cl- antiporter ClcA
LAADDTNGLQDVDRSLGDVVNRVSENASILVREEIELAKAEIEVKVKRLARGAAVAAAAGFFVFLGLIFAFHGLAWGISDYFNQPGWPGYLIVFGLLMLLAAGAGLFAYKSFQAGAPPVPERAIEEAKRTKEAIEHPELQAPVAPAEEVKS